MKFTAEEKLEIINEVINTLNRTKNTKIRLNNYDQVRDEFIVYFTSPKYRNKKLSFNDVWFNPKWWDFPSIEKLKDILPSEILADKKYSVIAKIAAWWWDWFIHDTD